MLATTRRSANVCVSRVSCRPASSFWKDKDLKWQQETWSPLFTPMIFPFMKRDLLLGLAWRQESCWCSCSCIFPCPFWSGTPWAFGVPPWTPRPQDCSRTDVPRCTSLPMLKKGPMKWYNSIMGGECCHNRGLSPVFNTKSANAAHDRRANFGFISRLYHTLWNYPVGWLILRRNWRTWKCERKETRTRLECSIQLDVESFPYELTIFINGF